ncbi:MAG TPA: hypothetical protein VFX89_02405 [Gammaproteobacteria bacterium]|nr:hypothetical protein [Gammaproteobacteria bacterium]
MGTQSFRGAGGAGAVRTSRTQLDLDRDGAARSDVEGAPDLLGRPRPRGRGWVLSLDVERRLREVRARVSQTSRARADDAVDVALIRPCRAGF